MWTFNHIFITIIKLRWYGFDPHVCCIIWRNFVFYIHWYLPVVWVDFGQITWHHACICCTCCIRAISYSRLCKWKNLSQSAQTRTHWNRKEAVINLMLFCVRTCIYYFQLERYFLRLKNPELAKVFLCLLAVSFIFDESWGRCAKSMKIFKV